jgi:excisionase family DNA binding protein
MIMLKQAEQGTMSDKKEELTIKQIVAELEVDERTVRRWISKGLLPAHTDIVGRWRVYREDLDAFVEARTRRNIPDED